MKIVVRAVVVVLVVRARRAKRARKAKRKTEEDEDKFRYHDSSGKEVQRADGHGHGAAADSLPAEFASNTQLQTNYESL